MTQLTTLRTDARSIHTAKNLYTTTQEGEQMMFQKKSSVFTSIVIISAVLAGLLLMAVPAAASHTNIQKRPFLADGLFIATPAIASPGETVQFSVDFTEYAALGMQHKPVGYVEWDFGDGSPVFVKGDLKPVSHVYQSSGQYTATATIYTTTFRLGQIDDVLEVPVDVEVGLTTRSESGAIATSESILTAFDLNANDLIEDQEFFELIDAWVQGELSDGVFFTAVDLWIMRASIAAAVSSSASAFEPQVRSSGSRQIVFSAGTEKYVETTVRIFDANGNLITVKRASGSQLRWNLQNDQGTQVANGVYFYTMSTTDYDGNLKHSRPQAVLVLR